MTIKDSLRALRDITGHPLNQRRKSGAVVDYLRWNIGRRLVNADQIVPLAEGARVIVTAQQNFGTLAYTCSLWDFEEMLFVMHFLRPADLFLDIGANAGGYTVLASAVAGARSIAFEPVPATYQDLLRNIRLNGIQDRARALCMGIGDVDGTLSMTADRGGLNHVVPDGWNGATVSVPVRRLDDVLDGEPCHIAKLDTEGFELNVLRGGPRTLAAPSLHALIVELNGSGLRYGVQDEAVHAEIVRNGFSPYAYDPVTRSLARLAGFNRDRLNTLYLRDIDTIQERVSSARQIRVRGRSF
jgi:FkbM family methyltransferase